jgi:hypothetical protein
MTAQIYPPRQEARQQRAAGQDRTATIALYDELLRRARSLPGVAAVAAANTTPLSSEIPILPVESEE